MNNYLILLVINIFLLVTGQILWKIGIEKVEELTTHSVWLLVGSPYVWGGLILYGVATIIWFKILSLAPLSVVYPMQSLAYILGIFVAWIIFGEAIPWTRWLGSFVILFGVYLVTMK